MIKVDESQRDSPARDSNGRCILSNPNEAGLLITPIPKGVFKYDGYSDKSASQKKILFDVFKKGDAYFNSGAYLSYQSLLLLINQGHATSTGDLLVRDLEGFLYWSDRVGDTFRWRGENVSTTEVENALSSVSGISTVVVYGVDVPNCDGRAGLPIQRAIINSLNNNYDVGMAAIALADSVSAANVGDLLNELISKATSNLPVYARPHFVRILDSVAVTSTFKYQKSDLVKEGFDLDVVKGGVFFCSWKSVTGGKFQYIPLTSSLISDMRSGKISV